MALTAYCKKCGREVAPAEICSLCGTRLGKTAAHAAWCVRKRPVADWMSWNAVMRILLPTGLAVLLLVFLLELLSGGTGALERMLSSGFPVTLLILLTSVTVLVLLMLALQGEELTDYVVDSRGIHVTRYLPNPTPLKLLLRFRSPALMQTDPAEGKGGAVIRVDARDLAWKDVARVQLWPEKCMILFYAPAWWMRVSVACTPFTWEDVMDFIREKLGKKKKVILPENLRVQQEKRQAAGKRSAVPLRPVNPAPAAWPEPEPAEVPAPAIPPEEAEPPISPENESEKNTEEQITMEKMSDILKE